MSEFHNKSEEEHARKRRRLDSNTPSRHAYQDATSFVQLPCEHYTVGWICALPLELAAAKAMLDFEHIPPKLSGSYGNIYTAGSMCGHNLVIACLPKGSYGNNSAAAIAHHMMSDFTSIKVPLLVGIGGGVPMADHDIRLGDVVISTPTSEQPAVVQHDLGKMVKNGILARKGTLNKPKPFLLRAVADMEATHKKHPDKIPEYISTALRRLHVAEHEFSYPGQENDILYELRCASAEQSCSGSVCVGENLVQRTPRSHSNPVVHYGPIASGNQVVKDAHTRDRFARELGVLCIEMEAAGMMDEYQCLVIRGICDYSDAHKNKRFQNYAALAAAAVTKELLSMLPVMNLVKSVDVTKVDDRISNHRKAMMDALDFDESNTRRATVKKAHKETCKWFLDLQEYQDWLNMDLFNVHQGLLWIKGKPGTGKSTIMKFVFEEATKRKAPDTIVMSFFFNARGHDLEKSTFGMYRSLVHQLLGAMPELQALLDNTRLSSNAASVFTVGFLQNLFRSAVESLASRRLICFVDALDECPEEQIRSMVEFFSEVGELATSQHVSFHVLFSSRHYPNIVIDIGRTLTLENQNGHSEDIVRYINTELKIGKNKQSDKIKEQIFLKSSGIFLWVVLVVRMLKSEYGKGKVRTLEKKLEEMPTKLDDLFRDIILRDGHQLPQLVLCMQWILFAARPLRREELYFALLAGEDSTPVSKWNQELETSLIMDSLILDTSKGLAEMTKSKTPTVQFIHESVREFLVKPEALHDLYHGFQGLQKGKSHQRLRECCERQIYSDVFAEVKLRDEMPKAKSEAGRSLREIAGVSFPFLGYAVEYATYHAEQAECSGVSQLRYVQTVLQSPWATLHDILQQHDTQRLKLWEGGTATFLCYLSKRDLPKILVLFLDMVSPIRFASNFDEARGLLIKDNKFEAFARLCKALNTCVNHAKNNIDADMLLVSKNEYNHAIYTAAYNGHNSTFKMLIEAGADVCTQGRDYGGALRTAVERANESIVKKLIEAGANVNAEAGFSGNVLHAAVARGGNDSIVRMLIEAGANVNAEGGHYGNALQLAAAVEGNDSIVRMLIEAGANVNAEAGFFGNALHAAVAVKGNDSIVRMLIGAGANVNAEGGKYGNALQAAARYGRDSVVKMLLEAGAEVNAKGGKYGSALHAAIERGHKAIAEILVHAGACDTAFNQGICPLSP